TVCFGSCTRARRAGSPTTVCPSERKRTTEGVTREPRWLGMIRERPPSKIATSELVVPKSIPTIFDIVLLSPPSLLRKLRSLYTYRAKDSRILGYRNYNADSASLSAVGGKGRERGAGE